MKKIKQAAILFIMVIVFGGSILPVNADGETYCSGVEFIISLSSTTNLTYTFACDDGAVVSSTLTKSTIKTSSTSVSVGSYSTGSTTTTYTKEYTVSIEEVGFHTIIITDSSGDSSSYCVTIVAHNWIAAGSISDPTCTETGVYAYNCTLCGQTKEESTAALGHEYNSEWTIDTAATCTTDGEKSRHCIRCDARTDITTIPATGHTWSDETTIDKEATCTEAGQSSIHCVNCSETKDITIIPATDHTWSNEITIDKEATCTEAGQSSIHCVNCSETKVTTIPATGHTWSDEITIDKEATCTEVGQSSIHCINCSETKDVTTIPATGHSFGDYVVTIQPTYTTTGLKERTCGVCGEKETAVIDKLTQTETEAKVEVTELKLNISSLPMKINTTFSWDESNIVASGGPVIKWKSSDSSIVSVTKKGKLKAKEVGTVKITCYNESGGSATFKVKVQSTAVSLKKITVNKKSVTLSLSGTKKFQIEVTKKPLTYSGRITYSSANKKIAKVSSTGKITAKKKGSTEIYVKCGSKTITIKVKVKK